MAETNLATLNDTPSRMHILFCLDYYYPHLGGAEVLFTALAEGLAAAGHTVSVVTQAVPEAPLQESRNGVQIHRVRTCGSRYLLPLAALPTLRKLAPKADLIHTTTFAAAPPAWCAAKLAHKPLVITVHEVWAGKWNQVSDASRWSNALNACLERALYWLDYQNYVTVSQATANDLQKAIGIPKQKITTIYNGLDYSFWNPDRHQPADIQRQPGDVVFFFSGRPGVSKGLPDLLQALALLVRTCPQAKLLALVSHAPAVRTGLEQARRLITDLGLEQHVSLRPPVPLQQLPGFILSTDVVVVPSLSEGFGFAAAEACALGKPVIATNNASLPEVVSGSTILVPPRQPQVLADAMLAAINHTFTISPYRAFPLQETLRRHLQLYAEILANHAR